MTLSFAISTDEAGMTTANRNGLEVERQRLIGDRVVRAGANVETVSERLRALHGTMKIAGTDRVHRGVKVVRQKVWIDSIRAKVLLAELLAKIKQLKHPMRSQLHQPKERTDVKQGNALFRRYSCNFIPNLASALWPLLLPNICRDIRVIFCWRTIAVAMQQEQKLESTVIYCSCN